MTSKNSLKNIIKESILEIVNDGSNIQDDNSLVNSLLQDRNNVPLWRVFHHETEDSIFDNGYSSEFFGDGEGSYHGIGVYAFYEPYGAEKRCGTGGVGDKIMKCVLIGGFKDFLILDGDMAMRYYGSDDIRTQLPELYGDNKELINAIAQKYRQVKGDFRLHHNASTGYISKALYNTFRDKLRSGKTRGVVYNGNNDPHAALIYNPREIIPIAVTNQTRMSGRDFSGWKVRLTRDLFNKNMNVLDFYSYGQKLKAEGKIRDFAKVPPVNDCMLVQLPNGRNTMYNVVDNVFVSNYGFDKCFGWEEMNIPTGDGNVRTNYFLPVNIGRKTFYIARNRKNKLYYFYEKASDFNYVMSLEEYDQRQNSEQENRRIVAESFEALYGGGKFLNVYHRTNPQNVENIVNKGGVSLEFNSANGNLAGPGVYFAFNVQDSNRLACYGSGMILCKLKDGIENFLIPQGAVINGRKFTETIEEQLNRLVPDKFKKEVFSKLGYLVKGNSAKDVYKALAASGDLIKTNIRGNIYWFGDIWAGVARVWTQVIPYKVSYDNGRTWQEKLTKSGADFIKAHGDAQYDLGKFIANGIIKNTFGDMQRGIEANQQYSYGYLRVVLASNNKISFYSSEDDNIISMAGFDNGFTAEGKEVDGEKFIVIPVSIKGKTYYIYKEEDGSYGLYTESDTFKLLKTNGRPLTTQDYDRTMINRG